jgi:hypothetical protein
MKPFLDGKCVMTSRRLTMTVDEWAYLECLGGSAWVRSALSDPEARPVPADPVLSDDDKYWRYLEHTRLRVAKWRAAKPERAKELAKKQNDKHRKPRTNS